MSANASTPTASTDGRIRAGKNGDAAAQRRRRRGTRWRRRRLPAFEELEGSEVNGVDGDSEAVESCWAFGFPNTLSVRNQLDDHCDCGSYRKPWALCCLHFPLCHWDLLFWLHGQLPFLSLFTSINVCIDMYVYLFCHGCFLSGFFTIIYEVCRSFWLRYLSLCLVSKKGKERKRKKFVSFEPAGLLGYFFKCLWFLKFFLLCEDELYCLIHMLLLLLLWLFYFCFLDCDFRKHL